MWVMGILISILGHGVSALWGRGGVKAFGVRGKNFGPVCGGGLFFGDPYDFHMGPKKKEDRKSQAKKFR